MKSSQLPVKTIIFVETMYDLLRPLYSPTPIYEVNQAEEYVEVTFLNGKSNLATNSRLEITAFDILVASLFLEDINILFEGITGVGKSYVTDLFFQTLFSEKSFYIDRANVNPFVESSVLTPFLTTILEKNIPKQYINEAQAKSIGAVFVEEVNRREINDLLSLLDKKLVLHGKRTDLGIMMQKADSKVMLLKKIIIIGSQNPVESTAPGSAQENDIAEDNRFLKIPFPNAVAESGSGQLQFSHTTSLHEDFWQEYKARIEKKIDKEEVKEPISQSWHELYVEATDLKSFSFDLSFTHREFIDLMLSYIKSNPKTEVDRHQSIINQVNPSLDLKFHLREDEMLQKIVDVQISLKYPIVRRDLNKIVNFSKLVALIRSIKQKSYNPVIDLADIVSSFGVLLEGRKIEIIETSMFDYVNDALQSYKRLLTNYKVKGNRSIREMVLGKAINNYMNSGKNLEVFQNTLRSLAEKNGSNHYPNPSMSVFNAKIVTDFMILEQFSRDYKNECITALNSPSPRTSLSEIYTNKLASLASIYVNRLHWLVETFSI
ncbi:MAG: hypothetical protein HeimC3_36390 [Candidatus Heimdallarchaeota archaeon LC_3]|nr:MAG: hypothetical protein HeimC3_36390 [Candidatus Heimdallarchaeota archaeon LC_3]